MPAQESPGTASVKETVSLNHIAHEKKEHLNCSLTCLSVCLYSIIRISFPPPSDYISRSENSLGDQDVSELTYVLSLYLSLSLRGTARAMQPAAVTNTRSWNVRIYIFFSEEVQHARL